MFSFLSLIAPCTLQCSVERIHHENQARLVEKGFISFHSTQLAVSKSVVHFHTKNENRLTFQCSIQRVPAPFIHKSQSALARFTKFKKRLAARKIAEGAEPAAGKKSTN